VLQTSDPDDRFWPGAKAPCAGSVKVNPAAANPIRQ
jgi:hypothetical protein